MKRRSLSESAANLTQPFDPSQNKHPEQVCQIISVNLNLTVRIKVQILERYWSLLVCLICRYIERNIERDLNDSKRFKRHSD